MTEELFNELMEIYKKFCVVASLTHEMTSNSLSDFLGYIQRLMSDDCDDK